MQKKKKKQAEKHTVRQKVYRYSGGCTEGANPNKGNDKTGRLVISVTKVPAREKEKGKRLKKKEKKGEKIKTENRKRKNERKMQRITKND